MRMPLILSAETAETYGVTSEHWSALQSAVSDLKIVLLLRAGKKASVHWIREKFPAKPKELGGLKTDKDLGLLVAKDQDEEKEAKSNQHGVLKKKLQQWVIEFDGSSPKTGLSALPEDVLRALGTNVCEGIVVDRSSSKPVTSDYDLAAIIFLERRKRGLTKMSVHQGGGQSKPRKTTVTRGPSGLPTITGGKHVARVGRNKNFQRRIDSGNNFSNNAIDQIVDALNAELGDKRIMHGPVANLDGNPAIGDEELLVIYPGKHSEIIIANDRWQAGEDLDDLLDELNL